MLMISKVVPFVKANLTWRMDQVDILGRNGASGLDDFGQEHTLPDDSYHPKELGLRKQPWLL